MQMSQGSSGWSRVGAISGASGQLPVVGTLGLAWAGGRVFSLDSVGATQGLCLGGDGQMGIWA